MLRGAGIAVALAAMVGMAAGVSPRGAAVLGVGTAEASTTCIQRIYAYGDTGTCVRYIQTMVNTAVRTQPRSMNHACGRTLLAVDGDWGPATEHHVRQFQSCWGGLKVDGVVGPNTWEGLCEIDRLTAAGCNNRMGGW